MPLAKIYDHKVENLVAYDCSDSALASLPYGMKLILYEINENSGSVTMLGRSVLPLRTVFLNSGVNGNI